MQKENGHRSARFLFVSSGASSLDLLPTVPTLPRATAAQPVAQHCRIEKQLADLRWGMGRMQRTLSKAQRDHIRAMLLDPEQLNKDGALTFGKIYKSLEKASLRQEFPSQFNTDRFSRETLLGDRTTKASVSRGELTAQLRRAWKLETVIPQVRIETKVDPKSEKPDNYLPLFDDDKPAMPISREEFDRFRACWENHHGPEVERTDRRIDKRIDHRHHLIDALVIGLTDRSLYMGMAKGYKERMSERCGS